MAAETAMCALVWRSWGRCAAGWRRQESPLRPASLAGLCFISACLLMSSGEHDILLACEQLRACLPAPLPVRCYGTACRLGSMHSLLSLCPCRAAIFFRDPDGNVSPSIDVMMLSQAHVFVPGHGVPGPWASSHAAMLIELQCCRFSNVWS